MTTSKMLINCSDRPSATCWVKASGDLLGLRDRDFGGDFAGALLWQDVLYLVSLVKLAKIHGVLCNAVCLIAVMRSDHLCHMCTS